MNIYLPGFEPAERNNKRTTGLRPICQHQRRQKSSKNGLKFNPEMKDEYETLKRTR